ncbi:MAG: hypothetical protein IJE08_14620 [Clostridia bacterium]|nr:hypothetical protein [Clostridia bacterium]
MSHLNEKVSYLRGLMEGMKLDTTTNEGLLLSKIVDVLDSIACDIADLADAHEELNEYVDSIDQDLSELEEVFEDELEDDYEDEDDDEDEEDDEDEDDDEEDDFEECDGNCEGCSGCDDEDVEYDGDIFVECMCPECKGTFYVKEEELDDEAFHICPRCGVRVHVVPDFEADIPVAALAEDEGEVN